MQPHGPVISRLPQQRDEALAFAQPVDAHQMRALGKGPERGEELCHLALRRFVTEDRKSECRLGDEEIAGHDLESIAGGIGLPLVVARDDGALTLMFDDQLCCAEDVAGRPQRYGDAANLECLAIGEGLKRSRRACAKPQLHDGDGIGGRQHGGMPGPRMIGVAMGYDGAIDRRMRVDVKSARQAVETRSVGPQPALERW